MRAVVLYATCLLIAKSAVAQIPDECKRPPPVTPKLEECCRLPQVFSEEELNRCGFEKLAEGAPPPPPPPHRGHPKRDGPPPCDKEACLLSSRGMATQVDGEWKVNRAAVSKLLDEQAAQHPEFAPSFAKAQQACLQTEQLPGPPYICEPIRTIMCVSATMFAECPSQAWAEGENCNEMRSFINTCKKFIN